MTEIKKKESIETLEKILALWKTKNVVSQFKEKRQKSADEDSNVVMFLGKKMSKKLIVPNSLEDITITAQRLCEEYIEARLERSGIKGFDSFNSTHSEEEYSNVVQNMGQILEMKYPRLYTKMSTHLKISYDSEIVVWDSFNKFSTHLFSEGITWAKILAFYAFTGGLALDCVTHGNNKIPGRIVYWFGVFVMKKLAAWIQDQGGWNAIADHFNSNPVNFGQDDDYSDDDNDENDGSRLQRLKSTFHRLTSDHDNYLRFIIISLVGVILSYVLLLYVRK